MQNELRVSLHGSVRYTTLSLDQFLFGEGSLSIEEGGTRFTTPNRDKNVEIDDWNKED